MNKRNWPEQIFVTAIGTDEGKTLISAMLANALQKPYFKPIECGGNDTKTVYNLSMGNEPSYPFSPIDSPSDTMSTSSYSSKASSQASSPTKSSPSILSSSSVTPNLSSQSLISRKKTAAVTCHPPSYHFKAALSPHAAAKLENTVINPERITLPKGPLIIEGAGGVLVPLRESPQPYLYIDLMEKWRIPTVIVVSHKIGCINHTLLTIEALLKRKIPILGIILSGGKNEIHKNAIESFSNLEVLGEIPFLENISKTSLIKSFHENIRCPNY